MSLLIHQRVHECIGRSGVTAIGLDRLRGLANSTALRSNRCDSRIFVSAQLVCPPFEKQLGETWAYVVFSGMRLHGVLDVSCYSFTTYHKSENALRHSMHTAGAHGTWRVNAALCCAAGGICGNSSFGRVRKIMVQGFVHSCLLRYTLDRTGMIWAEQRMIAAVQPFPNPPRHNTQHRLMQSPKPIASIDPQQLAPTP